MTDETPETIRVDKWLWHARFFKTRGLATRVVGDGKVRVDGTPISKPARTVGPGNVLTFAQGRVIRVVKIVAVGDRRGPAAEAQGLYEDLTPPAAQAPPKNPRFEGKGRPGKKERRGMAQQKGDIGDRDLE
ncbi:RNA-binding S4 domain-containing protein [Aestuariibius sp. 2305UL40-4]|uniref:RNA-binding S4 domain-containing protein n=1 Tax=Aestuariibius violaceus TaxID=3234132 RepID=UPI00345EDDBE